MQGITLRRPSISSTGQPEEIELTGVKRGSAEPHSRTGKTTPVIHAITPPEFDPPEEPQGPRIVRRPNTAAQMHRQVDDAINGAMQKLNELGVEPSKLDVEMAVVGDLLKQDSKVDPKFVEDFKGFCKDDYPQTYHELTRSLEAYFNAVPRNETHAAAVVRYGKNTLILAAHTLLLLSVAYLARNVFLTQAHLNPNSPDTPGAEPWYSEETQQIIDATCLVLSAALELIGAAVDFKQDRHTAQSLVSRGVMVGAAVAAGLAATFTPGGPTALLGLFSGLTLYGFVRDFLHTTFKLKDTVQGIGTRATVQSALAYGLNQFGASIIIDTLTGSNRTFGVGAPRADYLVGAGSWISPITNDVAELVDTATFTAISKHHEVQNFKDDIIYKRDEIIKKLYDVKIEALAEKFDAYNAGTITDTELQTHIRNKVVRYLVDNMDERMQLRLEIQSPSTNFTDTWLTKFPQRNMLVTAIFCSLIPVRYLTEDWGLLQGEVFASLCGAAVTTILYIPFLKSLDKAPPPPQEKILDDIKAVKEFLRAPPPPGTPLVAKNPNEQKILLLDDDPPLTGTPDSTVDEPVGMPTNMPFGEKFGGGGSAQPQTTSISEVISEQTVSNPQLSEEEVQHAHDCILDTAKALQEIFLTLETDVEDKIALLKVYRENLVALDSRAVMEAANSFPIESRQAVFNWAYKLRNDKNWDPGDLLIYLTRNDPFKLFQPSNPNALPPSDKIVEGEYKGSLLEEIPESRLALANELRISIKTIVDRIAEMEREKTPGLEDFIKAVQIHINEQPPGAVVEALGLFSARERPRIEAALKKMDIEIKQKIDKTYDAIKDEKLAPLQDNAPVASNVSQQEQTTQDQQIATPVPSDLPLPGIVDRMKQLLTTPPVSPRAERNIPASERPGDFGKLQETYGSPVSPNSGRKNK